MFVHGLRKRTSAAFVFIIVTGGAATNTCSSRTLPFWRNLSSCCHKMDLKKSLKQWKFSEPLLAELPTDLQLNNRVLANVPKVVFSRVFPTPFQQPTKLVAFSSQVLRDMLEMDPESMPEDPEFVNFVSGNHVLAGSVPISHRYGGHQFGQWADQLGDGRAVLLGEYVNRKGERWELQLKGSGKTPYSRFGDGRAVLRSSIREFLCSEAMHHLGIPTSRAAAVIVADDRVVRDVFYDGRPTLERCAVVLRVAQTWFRIGSLQILSYHAEIEQLQHLMNFVLKHHFPDIRDGPDKILEVYSRAVQETAELIAKWTSVGFVHGVMNTDNLSLVSITIDYGPFGFVDDYDPNYIPNHSDDQGRYSLVNQPAVAEWNLRMLAQSLMPLVPSSKHDQFRMVLRGFRRSYDKHLLNLFRKKLGLQTESAQLDEADEKLMNEWLSCLKISQSDFTQSFRDLSEISDQDLFESNIDKDSFRALSKVSLHAPNFSKFLSLYESRLKLETGNRNEVMKSANPRYVLRQWMVQRAIEKAEKDDFSEVRLLLKVLNQPFLTQPEAEAAGYAGPVPHWAKRLVLSCSS